MEQITTFVTTLGLGFSRWMIETILLQEDLTLRASHWHHPATQQRCPWKSEVSHGFEQNTSPFIQMHGEWILHKQASLQIFSCIVRNLQKSHSQKMSLSGKWKSSPFTQCDNTIWKRFKILIVFVCFIQSILQSKWTEEHFSYSFESLCNTWEKDTLFLGSPLFFHSGLLLFWPYYPQASHIHSW